METHKEVERLQTELTASAKPTVFLEGKQDRTILKTAWKKLFPDTTSPYTFESCDPLPEGTGGGAGGCDTLANLLNTWRSDSQNVAIGIFDRDKAGIDAYNALQRHLEESPDIQDVKISKNGKAAAYLLPIPPGKADYAKCLNLRIEFYFSEEALAQKTKDGHGLKFEQPLIEEKVKIHGNPVLSFKPSELPHTRQITDGKKVFAENIIPTLDAAEFEPFSLIFNKIQTILEYLKDSA